MKGKIQHPGSLRERPSGATPWRQRDRVVKFVEFPVRRDGLSHRDFHLYWQRHHSPMVMNASGFSRHIRKYVSAHGHELPVSGLPARFRQATGFDGASELWINALEEVPVWLSHPLYQELIQPDEIRFLDQSGKGRVMLSAEQRVFDGDPDLHETGLVRLYVLLAMGQGAREDFNAAVSMLGSRLLAAGSRYLAGIAINHRLDDPLPLELPAPGFDAVVTLTTPTVQALVSMLNLPAMERIWKDAPIPKPDELPALVTTLCAVHDEFSFQPTTTCPHAFSWSDPDT